MKITAARESGNPQAALAVVGSLFGVAFAILLLPREPVISDQRVARLPARSSVVFSELATPLVDERPMLRGGRLPIASRLTLPTPVPERLAAVESADLESILTFTTPPEAELPVLPSAPIGTPAIPTAVMTPPLLDAGGDHLITTAFRTTGVAVKGAFRKTVDLLIW